jgi:hypothetical protein
MCECPCQSAPKGVQPLWCIVWVAHTEVSADACENACGSRHTPQKHTHTHPSCVDVSHTHVHMYCVHVSHKHTYCVHVSKTHTYTYTHLLCGNVPPGRGGTPIAPRPCSHLSYQLRSSSLSYVCVCVCVCTHVCMCLCACICVLCVHICAYVYVLNPGTLNPFFCARVYVRVCIRVLWMLVFMCPICIVCLHVYMCSSQARSSSLNCVSMCVFIHSRHTQAVCPV